ncbi:MAG: TIM barrel protein [Verrucomicrobia bacterium]|nr:TIM barrel protein [Cytophagales bacterium]
MQRRDFMKKSLATMSFAGISLNLSAEILPENMPKNTFNLKYAPHFGMFENSAGKDLIAQLQFMAAQGFMALEDNGMMNRSTAEQEKIGKELSRLGMSMGVFVIDGGDNWKTSLTSGKTEFVENFVKTCKQAVEVAKRCNAKWMTVVPGFYDNSKSIHFQTAHVVEALRKGAAIFEPHGLIMVLEPLSDTPDLFLRYSDQTYAICKAVNSPSCKLLFDIYHMQRNEGNLIANMERCWSEIAYVQIGDNPGRKEPTTGEINYKNVFRWLFEKGFQGVMGMEHGNAKPGAAGETSLIQAYLASDDFLNPVEKKLENAPKVMKKK